MTITMFVLTLAIIVLFLIDNCRSNEIFNNFGKYHHTIPNNVFNRNNEFRFKETISGLKNPSNLLVYNQIRNILGTI